MSIICRRVQSRLSALIDGELPVAEAAWVRDHLDECASCRAEEDGVRSAKRMASVWGVYQPPSDLQWRLDPAAIAARARASERAPWWQRLRIALAPATGLAATAAAVALLWNSSAQPPNATVAGNGPVQVAVVPRSMDQRLVPSRPAPPERHLSTAPAAPSLGRSVVAARDGHEAPSAARAGAAAPSTRRTPAAAESHLRAPSSHALARPTRRAASIREPAAAGMSRHLLATSGGGTQRPVRSQARRGTRGARPLLRTPAPERVPPAVRRQEPRRQGPIEVAATLYAQGHYNQAASVLNDAIRRSSQRWPDDLRAVYHERNSLADADISECSGALRYDPGNVNARKFLDKAYTTKVDILRSLTG